MADRTASGAEQSPESRLLGAGFTRRLDFWVPPGEERTLDLDDAIGMLDAGEVQPDLGSWRGVHPDALVGCRAPSEEEIDRMLHPPPATESPPLPGWAEPWAAEIAALLTPIIRREIRAAARAEARRQAREPRAWACGFCPGAASELGMRRITAPPSVSPGWCQGVLGSISPTMAPPDR
jgi:hypothetical protein